MFNDSNCSSPAGLLPLLCISKYPHAFDSEEKVLSSLVAGKFINSIVNNSKNSIISTSLKFDLNTDSDISNAWRLLVNKCNKINLSG